MPHDVSGAWSDSSPVLLSSDRNRARWRARRYETVEAISECGGEKRRNGASRGTDDCGEREERTNAAMWTSARGR